MKKETPQLTAEEMELRSLAMASDETGVDGEDSMPEGEGLRAPSTDDGTEEKTDQGNNPEKEDSPDTQQENEAKSGTKQAEKKEEGKTDESKKQDSNSEPTDSKFVKAKKEAARLDKSWKALEAEKERVRSEAETLAKAKSEVEQERKKIAAPKDRSEELEAKAKEYDKGAISFEKEGRDDMAEACREQAKSIRDEIKQNQAEVVESKRNEFIEIWDGHLAKYEQEIPELKDQKSEKYKEVFGIIQEFPVLRSYPHGIRDACEVLKLRTTARLVPDLQKKLAEAETKITELQKATQLPATTRSERSGKPKTLGQMSDEDQVNAIKEMAREVDEAEAFV